MTQVQTPPAPPPPATEPLKPRRPWRDNLEAFGVAILMAVLLKPTIVEAYQIPTSSMQPTLMGSSEAGVYDRILVDKFRYEVTEPKRWDIAVFRYPIRRNQNYVKRIVGIPGDRLRIAGGNIYQVGEDGKIAGINRKPADVQKGLWKQIYPARRELELATGNAAHVLHEYFEGHAGSWQEDGDTLVGTPSSKGRVGLAYTDTAHNGISNQIYDGYPTSEAEDIRRNAAAGGFEGVQDVRFGFTVEPEKTPHDLVAELVLKPAGHPDQTYRLQVTDGQGALAIVVGDDEVARSEPFAVPLQPGQATSLRLAHVDDLLTAEVNGARVAELEVGDARMTLPLEPSQVRLHLDADGSGELRVRDLTVDRDLHYVTTGLDDDLAHLVPEGQEPAMMNHVIRVPEGHYFMMGDNTLASADGRQWQEVRVGVKDGRVVDPALAKTDPSVKVLAGNKRPWDLNSRPDVDENPVIVRGKNGQPDRIAFTDAEGEVYALTGHIGPDYSPRNMQFMSDDGTTWVAPDQHRYFVPRGDVLGRPVLTFWPLISPFRGGFIH